MADVSPPTAQPEARQAVQSPAQTLNPKPESPVWQALPEVVAAAASQAASETGV